MEIFGIELDMLTAKDALKTIVQYMETETINTVELVTLELLMQGKSDPQWLEQIKRTDLVLPGEKALLDISEASGFYEEEAKKQRKELTNKTFIKLFFKYLQRSRKEVFLLAEKEEDLAFLEEMLWAYTEGLLITGQAVLPERGTGEEKVINEINGVEPDCIISILPYPVRESFISDSRALLNARIWVGMDGFLLKEGRKTSEKLRQFLLKRIFCHLAGQKKSENDSGE